MEIYDKSKEMCLPNNTNICKYIEENKCKKCVYYCTPLCTPTVYHRTKATTDKRCRVIKCFKSKEES